MAGPGFNPWHPPTCRCRKCAARREAAASFVDRPDGGPGRESIKRSHRAEGRNFID